MRLLAPAPLALLTALTALTAPACSKLLGGFNDVSLREDAAASDAGPPPDTVIGRSYTRHQTTRGDTDVPRDLSTAVIQALIVDATQPSGYRVSPGTGRADGTFTIPEVPDGAPFLLKLDASYYATTAHDLDLHDEVPTRGAPAPAQPTSMTSMSFNVQNMSPFVNGPEGTLSYIELDSLQLAYQGLLDPLPHNTRSLVTSVNWERGTSLVDGTTPLPETAHGDDVTLLHFRNEVITSASSRKQRLTRVVDTYMTPAITVANGTNTPLTGSFSAASSNRSISLSVTRGEYDAGHDAGSLAGWTTVTLYANPVPTHRQVGATVFQLELSDWSRSGVLTEQHGFMYADPYPATWARTLITSYERVRYLRLPNTSLPLPVRVTNQRAVRYSGGAPAVSPALQPPSSIRIAGQDALLGGLVEFDGVAPVELAWNRSAGAEVYEIRVDRVFQNGAQTSSAFAASLRTVDASIRIPAEVFSGAEFFAFTVTATQSPADYAAGELIPNGLPIAAAAMATAMFRLSDRCGNGVVDPGEQCDTSGESATCDRDCTLPECRDGLRNAMAGEACDTVRGTAACDTDCTLPMCGDNRVNEALEDCDDGNPADTGNGCSASCRFNNICGNGTVQSLVEQCDPGTPGADSATCDSDCTFARCGDGHHNAVAGEACDDGNDNDNDGCTSSCTTS